MIKAEVPRTKGHSVIDAENGYDALSILTKGSKADLVVGDVVMLELGGREFLRSARELKPGLACLFPSGYTDEPPEDLVGPLDGAAFIAKPFTIGQLSSTVRWVLREKGE